MIRIENLSFGYSKKKLLYQDLDLSINTGRIYGLLGKNGAGKSTLLKNISGLLFPLKGRIFANDHEPRKRLPSFLENIYLLPEEVYVPAISFDRYVNLFSPFYPRFDHDQFLAYTHQLEMEKVTNLKKMSFGQQKKFVIAFALACNTPLLLLDEPTNGLDIPSKAQFRRLLASAMNEDRIVLISTHQTRDLENLIDAILIIDNGHLLLDASIDEIGRRLCFTATHHLPEEGTVLYSEESLGGFAVVKENRGEGSGRINLEQLFNAVTQKPQRIKAIFQFSNSDHE
jgi:ABC-2 type transport system ATP-binding protein